MFTVIPRSSIPPSPLLPGLFTPELIQPRKWVECVCYVFGVKSVFFVSIKHREELQRHLFAQNHEVDRHDVSVEDDRVGEEHVLEYAHEVVLFLLGFWSQVLLVDEAED